MPKPIATDHTHAFDLYLVSCKCGTILGVGVMGDAGDTTEIEKVADRPCPTCALKAEFEQKLKALEVRRRMPPQSSRDF